MDNPFLIGEMIYLRPFDAAADARVSAAWFNDPETRRTLRRYAPMSVAQQESFLGSSGTMALVLAIVERADNRLIGSCGLHDIEPRHRVGEIGIVIGAKSDRGKGRGKEAMSLLIRHAFWTLNLNRLVLSVYDFNETAWRLYEKLGFQIEGRLRQDFFVDGEYHDTLLMGLLRAEWEQKARKS